MADDQVAGERRALTPAEVDAEASNQIAAFAAMGHPMSPAAIARVRRLYAGELTLDEARNEILAKYSAE